MLYKFTQQCDYRVLTAAIRHSSYIVDYVEIKVRQTSSFGFLVFEVIGARCIGFETFLVVNWSKIFLVQNTC
jgi:hypothetical protein